MPKILSSEMVAALEFTWTEIQRQHPDVQHAIFTLYHETKGNSRGYYASKRWKDNAKKNYDEVKIDTIILKEGAASVLRTLIHEAVHSHNNKLNIQDVSRNNRYHNKHFKKAAEAFGLTCEADKVIGIITTNVKPDTLKLYKLQLARLTKAIKAYQDPTLKIEGTEKSRQLKAECECDDPRVIRLSAKVYSQGAIKCQLCHAPFTLSQ